MLRPASADELDATQREQLRIAWEYYSGDDEDPVKLVAENPNWFELWTVVEGDKPVFDYVHFPPDQGTLFYAGSKAPTGIRVIQFGWDVEDEDAPNEAGLDLEAVAEALSTAWSDRPEPPPRPKPASTVQKSAPEKAPAKKRAAKKTAAKKGAAKKTAAKKGAAKKPAAKKPAAKKPAAKKGAAKKSAPKKTAAKKTARAKR
jgi:hypothetical protein